MSTLFVLVRHATCARMDDILFGRIVDASLDERGLEQARLLARALAGRFDLAAIETSPRRRTRQTAEAIARESGCDTRVAHRLDEIDFGSWSGQSFRELSHDSEWRAWNTHRASARTPAGDSIRAVQGRVIEHLHGLRGDHGGRAIALVTHSEIIRSVLMHCLDVSADCYERIAIDPASTTTIRFGEDWLRVESVNEHLIS